MIPGSVAIITQARTGSSRLPRKVFLPAGEKPLLEHHVERLEASGVPVVINTTRSLNDQVISEFARTRRLPVFCGSEHDVLERYYECARHFGLKTIVRVCSDCPLIDGHMIRGAVELYSALANPRIYLSNVSQRSFPRGFDFEVFSFEALEAAFLNARTPDEREHVTPYLRNNVSGTMLFYDIVRSPNASKYRLVVDTREDYEVMRKLIEWHAGHSLACEEIIKLLEAHPELEAFEK